MYLETENGFMYCNIEQYINSQFNRRNTVKYILLKDFVY